MAEYNRVSRDSKPRNYNILDPSDLDIQFFFYLRPGFEIDNKQRSQYSSSVNSERAEEIPVDASPLETAQALLDAHNKYVYSRKKDELPLLIEFLEKWEAQDLYDTAKAKVERLKQRLSEAHKELKLAENLLEYEYNEKIENYDPK